MAVFYNVGIVGTAITNESAYITPAALGFEYWSDDDNISNCGTLDFVEKDSFMHEANTLNWIVTLCEKR